MEDEQKKGYPPNINLAPLLKDMERTTKAVRDATRPMAQALANFQAAVNFGQVGESIAALTEALDTDALRGLEHLHESLGLDPTKIEEIAAGLAEQLAGVRAVKLTPLSTRQTQTAGRPALTVHGQISTVEGPSHLEVFRDYVRGLSIGDLFSLLTTLAAYAPILSLALGIYHCNQHTAPHEAVTEGIDDHAARESTRVQEFECLQDSVGIVLKFQHLTHEELQQRLSGDAASD